MGFTLVHGVCYISLELELHPNVPLSETVSRSNDSATKTLKGQGTISRSWDFFTLLFSVWSYRLSSLNDLSLKFTQMLPSLRRCTEPMTQVRTVKVKVTHKGNGIYPSILCLLHIFQRFEGVSLNFTKLFLSVRQ